MFTSWDGRVPGKEDCMNKIRETKNPWHVKGSRQPKYKVYGQREKGKRSVDNNYTTPAYSFPSTVVEDILKIVKWHQIISAIF